MKEKINHSIGNSIRKSIKRRKNGYHDEDFKKCWNINNLRLFPKFKNLSKGGKLDKKTIINYDIENLLPEGINLDDI